MALFWSSCIPAPAVVNGGRRACKMYWRLVPLEVVPIITLQSAMPSSMTDGVLETLLTSLAKFYFANPLRLENLSSS